ncbi:hypothetical protein C9E81_14650 [Paracoccus alkanivorans]|uniref:Uncharacterized protein n=1 Tax=Paracoccus alkanivorans TaxID=2116655 RepID=A0A3M0MAZ5_9RHOB|nr:hypothetical protein C9E81_14650 [Paracoccus alkanivorans]
MNTSRCGSSRIRGWRKAIHSRCLRFTSARLHLLAISDFLYENSGAFQQARDRGLMRSVPAVRLQRFGQFTQGDVGASFHQPDEVIPEYR